MAAKKKATPKKRIKPVVEEVEETPEVEEAPIPEPAESEVEEEATESADGGVSIEPDFGSEKEEETETVDEETPEPEKAMDEGEVVEEEEKEALAPVDNSHKMSLKTILLITLVSALVAAFVSGGVYVYLTGANGLDKAETVESEIVQEESTETTPTPEPEIIDADASDYSVQVLNGSGQIGAAGAGAEIVESVDFVVDDTGNAANYDFEATQVQAKSDVPQSLIDDFYTSRALWLAGRNRFVNTLSGFGSSELLVLLIEAMTGMLNEEMLVRSLYPLLNGDYIDSIQSPFSHSTQNAVSAQLTSVEQLLLNTDSNQGLSLDSILISLSFNFEELFYQNFDASKECLVLLYSTLGSPEDTRDRLRAEFEIVECINLVTNMIDHLEQIKVSLYDPV